MRALVVLLVLISFSISAQNGSTNEAIIWTSYTEKIQFSDKWDAALSIQHRNFVERDKDYHLLFNIGMTRNLGNGFSVGAGLANLNINQIVGSVYVLVPEVRPYQHVGYGISFEKITFKWRFMIEERFFRNAEDGNLVSGHSFNYRLRNQAQIGFSISKNFSLSAGTEIFFNAGGVANLNAFDQHRASLLANFKLAKMAISTGYMHWGVLTGGDVFENRHTWQILVSHSLDLSN